MAIYKEYLKTNNALMKVPFTEVRCKYCGGRNVTKYGTFRGRQRFWCKDCKRKFADNDALPNMQTPVDQVGTAVSMFYEGQSLNSIRRLLTQIYHSYPSDSTVYRWVSKFTKKAIKEAKDYHPQVGDVWVADETVLKIDGKNVWFWDVIDADTRFLLASRISKSRTIKEAALLMNEAKLKAGKSPKQILTDGLPAYRDGIELVFGADTKHIRGEPFDTEKNTNRIERFHSTLKSRTKIMRGLKDIKSARLFTDGWLFYYNYLRPHESLDDRTPARIAGLKIPYRNWGDLISNRRVITPAMSSATSTLTIPELPEEPRRRLAKKRLVKPKSHKRRSKPIASLAGMRG